MGQAQPQKQGRADLGPKWKNEMGPISARKTSTVSAKTGPDLQGWASIGLAQHLTAQRGEELIFFLPPPACKR